MIFKRVSGFTRWVKLLTVVCGIALSSGALAVTGTLSGDTGAFQEGDSCVQLAKAEGTLKASGDFGGGDMTLAVRAADGLTAQTLTNEAGTIIVWGNDFITGVNLHAAGCVLFQLDNSTNPDIVWEIVPKTS